MKRGGGSQYNEVGNEIGKRHSNVSIDFDSLQLFLCLLGAFLSGFSFGSFLVSSTSSPDCQNSRYGLIVVPNTAIRAAKYSPFKEIVGIRVPRTTSAQLI
jgi:hypothetical protein